MEGWQEFLKANTAFAAIHTILMHLPETYMVGGAVRDALLGAAHFTELDLTTTSDVPALLQEIGRVDGVCDIKNYARFGTASIMLANGDLHRIDIVRARREEYLHPGALPETVPSDLDDDLRRRDFSINAIALPVNAWLEPQWRDALIDPVDGVNDLKHRHIRVLHEASFLDDPTRIFRAMRYKSRISGNLHSDTHRLMQEAITRRALSTIAIERIVTELKLVAAESKARNIIQELATFSLFGSLDVPQLDLEIPKLWQSLQADEPDKLFLILRLYWLYFSSKDSHATLAPKLRLSARIVEQLHREGLGAITSILNKNG